MAKDTKVVTITAPVGNPSKRYWRFDDDPKTDAEDKKVRDIVGSNYFSKEKYPEWENAVAVEITFKPIFKQ